MNSEEEAKFALLRDTLQKNIGLSEYESKVYLALVQGGFQTMSELAKTSDVPKQRVYDTVETLREQGFVEMIDDYPRKAYAIDPSEALSEVHNRLDRAEKYLEELHETVENVENGVALFKSDATIRKYITSLVRNAERDILLLCPLGDLDAVLPLLEDRDEQHVRLIVSDIEPDAEDNERVSLEYSIPDTVDAIRGVTSTEDFAVTVDRKRGLYWTRESTARGTDEQQGYYITNPNLALVLDRFVSASVWPFARPLSGRSQSPTLPKEYLRLRDCLSDLEMLSDSRPLTTLEVEFHGYDTTTGEEVQKRGVLAGYYYTEYDLRASLTIDVHDDGDAVDSSLVTVGGLGTRIEDYSAHSLTLRYEGEQRDRLDEETESHLETCLDELPHEFGARSIVVGFDAFVDRMREIVGDWSEDRYERVGRFDEFKESLIAFEASESAPRVEWRQTKIEAGGHVAHVGRVFDRLDYDVTLIGHLGTPVHTVFGREFSNQTLVSVGESTYTDYVRFDDRKLLFTEPNLSPLDWETILDHVGVEELAEYLDGTPVLSLGTLYSTPQLPSILQGLENDLWPTLRSPPENVHFSPGAIERFDDTTVKRGYDALAAFDNVAPVTVTANRKQTRRFRDLLDGRSGDESTPTVEQVRDELDVSRYIMHSFREATLANGAEVLTARVPQVVKPRQMQNVDEHFVSGVSLALAEGLSDGAVLILGNSVASYFMRHNEVPGKDELRSFVAEYDSFFDYL
ncbi:TrmB family transcriptional regulator [Halomarina pelagica]|uniref:TrmB family transcriptional regulator n=1 Tax=Halomarina pelagica TaxID=2961599 RepID=UPI0020C46F12|nr:TrmB family transcriptional regulator sugar-binding domain-containing protein [Halomarina sp. BND7]